MDIQSAAAQLVKALGSNPELVSQFAQHPYSTTAQVTGTDETISQKDMSRILTQVAAQASGQKLDTGGTKDLASALMGQSGGSVHGLANALFGGAAQQAGPGGGFDLGSVLGALGGSPSGSAGAPSMAEIAAKSIAGGLAARGMAALITGAMTGKKDSAGK
jgi:hypothetical protein